jgi:putative intracellular protease/amidase
MLRGCSSPFAERHVNLFEGIATLTSGGPVTGHLCHATNRASRGCACRKARNDRIHGFRPIRPVLVGRARPGFADQRRSRDPAGATNDRGHRCRAFVTTNGVWIKPDRAFRDCDVPDLVVAPGESIARRFTDTVAWLRQCYDAGATLASACSGALLLAEAGLLDGCEATTHWASCEDMRRSYPA